MAPIMIHTACRRVIMPEFTNPTTITVVAEEDWMTAVMPAPTSTPKIRLEVSRSKIRFIWVACGGFQAGAHHLHAVQKKRQAP